MSDRIEHRFTGMVGSRPARMALTYDGWLVRLHIAGMVAVAYIREQLAAALVSTVADENVRVVDDLVVLDHPGALFVHAVVELADVEHFLNLTYAADPEPLDEAELAAILLAGA